MCGVFFEGIGGWVELGERDIVISIVGTPTQPQYPRNSPRSWYPLLKRYLVPPTQPNPQYPQRTPHTSRIAAL